MLPRISDQSNIPHISLSVALINLDHPSLNLATNQFHPSTHSTECLDSSTILQDAVDDIAYGYLEYVSVEPSMCKDDIIGELAESIIKYIELLKSGKLNDETLDMSVNEKAKFVENDLDKRLSVLAARYAI